MWSRVVCLWLLCPAVASAQSATIIIAERRGPDRAHFVAEFADKTQVDIDVPITDATVDGVKAFINGKRNPPPIVSAGTVIDLRVVTPPPPPPPPPPTDLDIWVERARRLARLKALGLTSPDAVTDIQELQALVDATYQKGFADAL